MGTVQKAKKVPKIESLGIVAEGRKKVIPKDITEKLWSNLTVRKY